MTPRPDLDAEAHALYGLHPSRFVQARDALARQLRAAGQREAATAVGAWRRPTVTAWLVNSLVRARPAEIADFVDLGASMREATASMSGPDLRALSAQRHQLVQALVVQARALARDAGQPAGEDALRGVEQSLHAALADQRAAASLLAGRLTHPLQHSGFAPGPPGAGDERPVPGTARRPAPAGRERRTTAVRAELEAQRAAAWARARATADARDEATRTARASARAAEAAGAAARRAAEQVQRLAEQVRVAREEQAAAESVRAQAAARAADAERERVAAEQAADEARHALGEVQARLDRLGSSDR